MPLGAPGDEELEAILRRIVVRLLHLLRPRAEGMGDEQPDALSSAQADALLVPIAAPQDPSRRKRHSAFLEGFSLHAGVHLHANDREGLERLLRYGARPPLSLARLAQLPDGRLAYRLKRPVADDRQVLVLQPTELLRRLATLVPPPRHHLCRYHTPRFVRRSRIRGSKCSRRTLRGEAKSCRCRLSSLPRLPRSCRTNR